MIRRRVCGPGLSVTAKITTATRSNVVSIPIQALTVRNPADLVPKDATKGVGAGGALPLRTAAKSKEEIQGVFVIRNKKAEFVPVDTGISGTTDIEVTKGLKEGDEVITGSYKVLRTLKPGTSVKIDNSTPSKEEEQLNDLCGDGVAPTLSCFWKGRGEPRLHEWRGV